MCQKIKSFLIVPQDIKDEFMQMCVKKNKMSLIIICAIIFPSELFNIFRVLFLSQSGLGTLNNRIYFGMYLLMLAIPSAYLIVAHVFRNSSQRVQLMIQYAAMLALFMWHVSLNTYDLRGDSAPQVYIYCTAIVGISIFMHMPNVYVILLMMIGHLTFILLNIKYIDVGIMINMNFLFMVSLGMAFSQFHSSVLAISQNKKIHEINRKLEELIEQDHMLSVLNKSAMEKRVINALKNVDKDNPIGVFMIDLDNFKNVNDEYGHPCGDYVLSEVAARMKRALSDTAYSLGRIGGDEFAIMLSNPVCPERLQQYADRIMEDTRNITWQGRDLEISCSMGVLFVERKKLEFDEVYHEVDALLYNAKQRGKGIYLFKELE